MIETNVIYNENCLDTLARMPDEFLDCVVTSPPYYGLRDYGTATWIGGDEGCDHSTPRSRGDDIKPTDKQGTTAGSRPNTQQVCRCGAVRQDEQIGLEVTFQEYLSKLLAIFKEIKRTLKPTGSVWVNLGDSYSGSGKGPEGNLSNGNTFRHLEGAVKPNRQLRPKSLMNIPARFAIAMTDELGFILRNEIIWHKPSCMPFSGKDRFTVDFEPMFFFTKNERYYFEQQLEPTLTFDHTNRDRDISKLNNTPGRTRMAGLKTNAYEMKNKRTTWSIPFEPSGAEHYASYPTKLIATPILASCPPGGIVYDPFTGTATTQFMAQKLGRKWIGSELSPEYCEIANKRMKTLLDQPQLFV